MENNHNSAAKTQMTVHNEAPITLGDNGKGIVIRSTNTTGVGGTLTLKDSGTGRDDLCYLTVFQWKPSAFGSYCESIARQKARQAHTNLVHFISKHNETEQSKELSYFRLRNLDF